MLKWHRGAVFYYQDDVKFDEKAANKFLKPEIVTLLEKSAAYIEDLEIYTQEELESVFKKIMEETNLKFGKIAQPLRVVITGSTMSPGIFEMLLALGKEKTILRIKSAIQMIEDSLSSGCGESSQ